MRYTHESDGVQGMISSARVTRWNGSSATTARLATTVFPYLRVAETMRRALAGERDPDGDRAANKEAVQDGEDRADAGNRGSEGRCGREDGAQVPPGSAVTERTKGGAALAHAARWPPMCGRIASQLSSNPGLEAKTILAALQRQYPERFADGQLRTLQRRIKRCGLVRACAGSVLGAGVSSRGVLRV